MSRIIPTLNAGGCVSIVGERRAGKSSLLNYLEANLVSDSFIPVKIDAQLVVPRNDKVFLERLVTNTVNKVKAIQGSGKITLSTPAAKLASCYTAFDKDISKIDQLLGKLATHSHCKIIWLVDEIEVLRDYKDSDLFTFLRPLVLDHNRFRMIIFGCDVRYEEDKQSDWRKFFSAFQLVTLNSLPKSIAKQMIEDVVTGFGTQLDDKKFDLIFDWTGCKPYLIKYYCSILVNILNVRATDYTIDIDNLIETEEVFLTEKDVKDHFNYLWDKHATEQQQKLLSILADKPSLSSPEQILDTLKERQMIQADPLALQHIMDDLNRLEKQGFLYQKDGIFEFSSRCLQRWVKSYKPIQ